jgi:hypothetical protein
MKSLAVLVLRFKEPHAERWKVPLNIRVGRTEIPLGLMLITAILFSLASINVLTKKTATISGAAFTGIVFTVFSVCERRFRRRDGHEARLGEEPEKERFRLELQEDLSLESLQVRPENILVAVHDPENLHHLNKVMEETDTRERDIVVVSVNSQVRRNPEQITDPRQVMDDDEISVFSKVVHAAEKIGKPVRPIAIAGRDPFEAILEAAYQLRSSRVVLDASTVTSARELQQKIAAAWNRLSLPGTLRVEIVPRANQPPWDFTLGG